MQNRKKQIELFAFIQLYHSAFLFKKMERKSNFLDGKEENPYLWRKRELYHLSLNYHSGLVNLVPRRKS